MDRPIKTTVPQEFRLDGGGGAAIDVRRLTAVILAVYVLLVVSFYFLAGDQLRYRSSRGNLMMPAADRAAVELSEGSVVEQVFFARIDRIYSVSVQWGAYYRENAGNVTMELLRLSDGAPLLRGEFDVSTVTEGAILTMSADVPAEGVYERPLLLRLTSDSPAGQGVAPLIDSAAEARDGFGLTVNGERQNGMLCFAVSGEDYIWTGSHYWEFAAGLGALILGWLMLSWQRHRKGRRSWLFEIILVVRKYDFLIRQLVSRDFKTKYKRSVLGAFWSFLNPLLTMCVQYFVFSRIFRADIRHFSAYLVIGVVMFNFFSEVCSMDLLSIIGNAPLITKVYMPKYIYPLTRTMSSSVNLLIAFVPMLLVCLASGVEMKKSTVLAIFFFVCLAVFSLGLGLLLATSMVFFRDVQFLWSVMNMMWMYATPIFYPESILPDEFRLVIRLNPLYHFLKNARICILDGISPEPRAYFLCLAIAAAMLLVGLLVFKKNQDKFVLYL